jgi:hypothetical protein
MEQTVGGAWIFGFQGGSTHRFGKRHPEYEVAGATNNKNKAEITPDCDQPQDS